MSCLTIFLILQIIRLVTKIKSRKDKEENGKCDDVEKIGDGNGKKILDEMNIKAFLMEPKLSGKYILYPSVLDLAERSKFLAFVDHRELKRTQIVVFSSLN